MAYNNVKVKARQTVVQSSTQTKDLGTVSEVPMGEWNIDTPYKKLNKVRYVSTGGSGVTLLAKKASKGIEPFVSQGWQEVWMVENYDGGAVSPDGTYPDMTVGNATNAQNDESGVNIAEQFENINAKIPSTASAQNQLADKAFVNSSINNMAAFYITYTQGSATEMGQAFPTQASLLNATIFYSGTQVRVPTQNDYATVLADETQPKGVDGSYPTTRYVYQTNEVGGTYPNGQWGFQYVVNNTALTQAQVDAINSGITAELVEQIGAGSVTSVNGQTGAVTITPTSIGAAKVSALTNGSVTKIGTATIGSTTKPIYLNNGEPIECTCVLPIGAIYLAIHTVSPAAEMGGTWAYVGKYVLSTPNTQSVKIYGNGKGIRLQSSNGQNNLVMRYNGGNYCLSVSTAATSINAGETVSASTFLSKSNEAFGLATTASNSGIQGDIEIKGQDVFMYYRTA